MVILEAPLALPPISDAGIVSTSPAVYPTPGLLTNTNPGIVPSLALSI